MRPTHRGHNSGAEERGGSESESGCIAFGLHIPLPYLLLYHPVPGFKVLRTPIRLGALVLLGVSVSAARV